jgi:hypothetical protein
MGKQPSDEPDEPGTGGLLSMARRRLLVRVACRCVTRPYLVVISLRG